jgi:adenine specific DNA methylase Mod
VEKNQLYYGDNLAVLREYIGDESVDLIYLDPPFNSRQDYNVLFAERDGTRSASQIMASPGSGTWTPRPRTRRSSNAADASPTPCAPSELFSATAT